MKRTPKFLATLLAMILAAATGVVSASLPGSQEAAPERFAGRRAVLIVDTGQSNALGSQVAKTPTPFDSRVHFLASINRYDGSGRQSTVPTDFEWIEPAPGDAAVTDINPHNIPYVGHRLGGTGKSAQQLAYEIANAEDVDVYVISVCSGGSSSGRWLPGAQGLARIILEDFVPYWVYMTPALAAEVTVPDIVSWRQGESDASGGILPLDYAARIETIRSTAEGTWSGTDTIWLMGEPTYYWNWSGPTPARWEGINAAAQYGGENMIFVSSVWLKHVPGNEIHFSGMGNIGYGSRMFNALYGLAPAWQTDYRRPAGC